MVVLHPPSGDYGWDYGRSYTGVVAEFVLERELGGDEAFGWMTLIAAAREPGSAGW